MAPRCRIERARLKCARRDACVKVLTPRRRMPQVLPCSGAQRVHAPAARHTADLLADRCGSGRVDERAARTAADSAVDQLDGPGAIDHPAARARVTRDRLCTDCPTDSARCATADLYRSSSRLGARPLFVGLCRALMSSSTVYLFDNHTHLIGISATHARRAWARGSGDSQNRRGRAHRARGRRKTARRGHCP